ncbi:MAG: hypothetical protein ACERJ1_12825 [Halodesulfovibrio sp.]|uniref:hypothetical protein n=1 Tax=Halodesulfovibrio sp. TaxID=1912772 RepID=UPI00359D0704
MKQKRMYILVLAFAVLMFALGGCEPAPEKPTDSTAQTLPAKPTVVDADKAPTSPAVPETPVTPEEEQNVLKPEIADLAFAKETKPPFSQEDVQALVEKQIYLPEKLAMPTDRTPYKYGQHDLNNDGVAELFVLIQDQYFCGSGGCTAYLFSADGKKLSRFTVSEPPVFVSEKQTKGWKDLIITSRGVQHVMQHDGKKYPLNPSVQPKISRDEFVEKARTAAKQQEIYVQDGHNLRLKSTEELPLLSPYEDIMFVFDHYGDPTVAYSIDVRIENGKAVVLPDTTFE